MINELRHGLSVGVERAVDSVYMTMAVAGKLTHEDYQVINPMLENALIAVKRPDREKELPGRHRRRLPYGQNKNVVGCIFPQLQAATAPAPVSETTESKYR